MEIHGTIAPTSLDEAEVAFNHVGPTTQVVVRETTKVMEFDREEYSKHVTGDVIETVQDALSAESLLVTVDTRAKFDDWRLTHEEYVAVELGNPDAERVAWHAVPFAETVLATTLQNEEDVAVSTLRCSTFGRVYHDALLGEEAEGDDDALTGADDDTATDVAGTDGDATRTDR